MNSFFISAKWFHVAMYNFSKPNISTSKEIAIKTETIKRFLVPIIMFIVVIYLPDIVTWALSPEDMVFNGTFSNIDDTSVYISAIRQGAEGNWLFVSQFTPEQMQPILSYVPYLIVGKLQYLFGGEILFWFQVFKLISLLFALYSLTDLVLELFPKISGLQNTAMLLILFGSGISWLLILGYHHIPEFANELITPEWTLATSTISAPHFLLGIGCQASLISNVLKILNKQEAKTILRLFITVIILGLSYPFLVPVDILVLGAFLVYYCIKQRSIPWKILTYLVAGTLPMTFFILYYAIYIPSNPVLSNTLLSNNKINPPTLPGILSGFGLLILFAGYGAKSFLKNQNNTIFIFWIFLNIFCLYLPINFSGRFVLGMFIPFCLISAQGIYDLSNTLSNGRRIKKPLSSQLLRRILILLTFPSTLLFILWTISAPISNPGYPYFVPKTEFSALMWLSNQTNDNDLVIAEYPISNLLPRQSPARVFLGHLNLTIDLENKIKQEQQFWDPATDLKWREEFIEDWGIAYVYYGKFEKALSTEPIQIPGQLIYNRDGIQIFSVLP